MNQDDKVTYFGLTDFRNQRTQFGIKRVDRSRHVYIIGKTGMGKSTLLENMAAQDILNGEGMCFIDPHGSAIDTLLEYVPESRINDVVYFAPFDTDYPISFNVMEDVGADSRHLVVNGLMASFKKIWQDAWSARMEYILTNTLLALLEYPNSTLLGVNRMLAEKDYRDEILSKVTDASVKSFWVDEFGKWDPRYARESAAAIQNKIGQFTANPLIRNIIGQSQSTFDIRKLMDGRKILLINLSKGRIGEQNAKLLGGMIITKIYLAAMSRADVGGSLLKTLPDFFFYVDEFQNFATESFADILSEARKYKLSLTIAHQYVAQMQEEVKDAVVGNVGTMITFRIGADDAELFEKQFSPVFTAEDIVNLGKFQIYLSLMIDGIGSKPFSARSMAPIERPEHSYINQVIQASRRSYTKERSLAEQEINDWFQPIRKPERRVISDAKPSRIPSASVSRSSTPHGDSNQNTLKKPTTFVVSLEKSISSQMNSQKDLTPPAVVDETPFDIEEELFPLTAEQEMRKVVSSKLGKLLDTIGDEKIELPKVVTAAVSSPSHLPSRKPVHQKNTSNRTFSVKKPESNFTSNTQKQKSNFPLKSKQAEVSINKKTTTSTTTLKPSENILAGVVPQKTIEKKQVVRETQSSTRSSLKDLLARVTKEISTSAGTTDSQDTKKESFNQQKPEVHVSKKQVPIDDTTPKVPEVPEDVLRDILS